MVEYKNLSDIDLVLLLREGNQPAYAEIYSRYVNVLVRFTESKLYSLDDARDLVQDLFTGLWSDRKALIVNSTLKAYLFGIVKNQVITKIRKNIVREAYADRLRNLSPAFHSLDEELDAREVAFNIKRGLEGLPDKTKTIYQLSREENKSIKEIAEEMNLSDQTVKNQISIALKHLRKSISSFLFIFLDLFL